MSVIYFLIGVGVLVTGGFLIAFIWAVKSGQYDDDYTPSVRMLFDDYKNDSPVIGDKPPVIPSNDKSNEMKKSNNN
jgi:cbb3-type cytochrome oxidase maturation protein